MLVGGSEVAAREAERSTFMTLPRVVNSMVVAFYRLDSVERHVH